MYPQGCRYTKDHEWIAVEGDRGRIGVTDYAQKQLGDVVFVDLPRVGSSLDQFATFGVVESVKAVSSLYSPVDGEVIAVNTDLPGRLETLGSDPYGEGWMIKVALTGDGGAGKLMDFAAYQKQCAAEG